jgi:hypothetical protein
MVNQDTLDSGPPLRMSLGRRNPPKKVLLVIGNRLRSIGVEAHAAEPRRRAPVVRGA